MDVLEKILNKQMKTFEEDASDYKLMELHNNKMAKRYRHKNLWKTISIDWKIAPCPPQPIFHISLTSEE